MARPMTIPDGRNRRRPAQRAQILILERVAPRENFDILVDASREMYAHEVVVKSRAATNSCAGVSLLE